MAEKTKPFSHIKAQEALEQLNETKPTGEGLVYDLLRIFCGFGDGNIRRIRDGVGNKAKDGRTVLIPNLIAYRSKGEPDFHDEIKTMQTDPNVANELGIDIKVLPNASLEGEMQMLRLVK